MTREKQLGEILNLDDKKLSLLLVMALFPGVDSKLALLL